MQQDREWFRNHPGEREYIRPIVKGEVMRSQANPEKQYIVKVIYHNPGMRTRMFFEVPEGEEQAA